MRQHGVFAWAVLLLTASSATAQPLTFDRDAYASSLGARGIAVADFDRDGWLDFATANEGPSGVAILLNRGASGGGFQHMFVPLAGGPFDIAAGDFNKDSIPDLAVANADANQINILLGHAAGGFPAPSSIAADGNPRGLTVADMDADGNLDIIYTKFQNGTVQILRGNGAGGFTNWPGATTSGASPQGIAAGDFNRDGRMDLVVANAGASGLAMLSQTMTGTFLQREVPGPQRLNVVTVGDFNRDGKLDAAAASTGGNFVAVYLGGTGGLAHAASYPTGASPRGIAAVDLDHDGTLDLVTGNRGGNNVSVLPGAGSGAFERAMSFAAGPASRAVAAGDFNNDGLLDVATGNEDSASAAVLWNATMFTRAAFSFDRRIVGRPATSTHWSATIGLADFNEDGRFDAATSADTTAGAEGVAVILSSGSTTRLDAQGPYLNDLAAGDYNRDGHADIVIVTGYPSTITTYFGNGAGQFSGTTTTPASFYINQFIAADVNRDAKIDLVAWGWWENPAAGRAQIFLGAGDGRFMPGQTLPVAMDRDAITDIADVNRDGALDLLAPSSGRENASGAATLEVWLGDRRGMFASGAPIAFSRWFSISDAAAGDLNHDGYTDVVATGSSRNDDWGSAIVLGGASGFGDPDYIPALDPHFELADLNLDGHLDVVGALGGFDGTGIWHGRGDGAFAAPERFDYGTNELVVADFTGDGLPDILFPWSDNAIAVLVHERNATNTPPTADAGPDRSVKYEQQFQEEVNGVFLFAQGSDPDMHAVRFEWRNANGDLLATDPGLQLPPLGSGTYEFFVTVFDGRGGETRDSTVLTIVPLTEIVLHMKNGSTAGSWTIVNDASAAGGARAYDPDRGAPKAAAPQANPTSYAFAGFIADPAQAYKVWVRLKGDGNHWANDSVFLQFYGAEDASGNPMFALGTSSGLAVNLEECSGCGIAGWGWRDDAWGQRGVAPSATRVRFPGGSGDIMIQTREDGVSIDQIVLSSEKYVTTRPGAVKNDATILPATEWPYRQ
jgi:hypothetical protein